jgi:NarL family two-component system response regulator LiaR
MLKTVLTYGVVVAILVASMHFVDFHFTMRSLSLEVYLGLIALVFALAGIWLGGQFLKPKVIGAEIPESAESEIFIEKSAAPNSWTQDLSPRELEVLALISQGLSNQEIADRLFLSLNTVKTHSSNIFLKLDVKRRTQAVSKAREMGILS